MTDSLVYATLSTISGAYDVGISSVRARVVGQGMVINSSRAVLYASKGADFAEAAHAEAVATRDAIRSYGPR